MEYFKKTPNSLNYEYFRILLRVMFHSWDNYYHNSLSSVTLTPLTIKNVILNIIIKWKIDTCSIMNLYLCKIYKVFSFNPHFFTFQKALQTTRPFLSLSTINLPYTSSPFSTPKKQTNQNPSFLYSPNFYLHFSWYLSLFNFDTFFLT